MKNQRGDICILALFILLSVVVVGHWRVSGLLTQNIAQDLAEFDMHDAQHLRSSQPLSEYLRAPQRLAGRALHNLVQLPPRSDHDGRGRAAVPAALCLIAIHADETLRKTWEERCAGK